MDKTLKTTVSVVGVLILLVLAFAGGVLFDRTTNNLQPIRLGMDTGKIEDAVAEVATIISEEALEPANETSLTAGAVAGMLEATGDEHAAYFDTKHFQYFTEQNEGVFYGIGITIGREEDDLVIMSVMDGTPAKSAGLKADDVIVTIDGEARTPWDVDQAVMEIRGEEGTNVTLGILRNGEEDLREFTITRAKIDVPNIEKEMLGDGIGYVRLYSFTGNAQEEIKAAMEELKGKGAKGYILDLRDNPGGLLSESIDVASLFISDGVVVRVEDREGTVDEYKASGKVYTDAPLVVLINENSASASEIVGGALQDFGRATLVGEQSFGKGSVQDVVEVSFGGAVKLTIAHYVTPKGQIIDKKGLTPDVKVPMELELQAEKDTDTQLQKAIEVLKGKL